MKTSRRRYNFKEDVMLDARLLAAGTIDGVRGEQFEPGGIFSQLLDAFGWDRKRAYMRGLWLRRQDQAYQYRVGMMANSLMETATHKIIPEPGP